MSDLFIGEILALILLVPVLLRPFFRSFQRVEGIAVLPLLSLVSIIAVVMGSGLRASLLPALLYVVLLFLLGLPRLVRLIRKLPTDWYSPASAGFHAFLILLVAATVYVSWKTAPEAPLVSAAAPVRPVVRDVILRKTSRAAVRLWEAAEPKGLIIMAGDGSFSSGTRDTAARIIAASGYTVLEPSLYRYDADSPFMYFPNARRLTRIFEDAYRFRTNAEPRAYERDGADVMDFNLLLKWVAETYAESIGQASLPVFILAEGEAVNLVLEAVREYPFVKGVALFEEAGRYEASRVVFPTGTLRAEGLLSPLPLGAANASVLVITEGEAALFGYGEICSDDVAAAFLLGGSPDAERKKAELTARRVVSWLDAREAQ